MVIQVENSEELFDSKYYIQDNFKELREKIDKISSTILYIPKKLNLENEKKKFSKISEEKKNSLKGLPEELIIKLEEASVFHFFFLLIIFYFIKNRLY